MSRESRPRILVLVDTLRVGGPARLVTSSAIGLRRRGWDVRVAHLGIGDGSRFLAELEAAAVPVLDLALGALFDPRPALRLVGYLRRERINLLHSHNRYAHLIGRPAAALARSPVVSSVHYLTEDDLGWRGATRRMLDHLSARALCTRIVCVSEAQRQVYCRAAGLPSGRAEVLRTGIDTRRFLPDPAARARVRLTLGIPESALVYVAVAVLRPAKRVNLLLDALTRVRSRAGASRARLLVVGAGPERDALEAQAARLGLAETVCFLGLRADVPELLAAADIYVHPSQAEALPTGVLEAMAVGLPVVAADVGGVSEIVLDGETGWLVPPGDVEALAEAMLSLLDTTRRAALGESGRRWVQQHAGEDAWLDRFEALYQGAIRLSG